MTPDVRGSGHDRRPGRNDPDATGAVPRTQSPAELLIAHEADRMSEQLGLRGGECALLVTRGPGAGSSYRLAEGVISLGRSSTATIVLDDISVSRRHAEVRRDPDGYRIVDVGALNGTYVNDMAVEEALLAHGQEIRIGRFKLVFFSAAPAAK